MASKKLQRLRLEKAAIALIVTGQVLLVGSWIVSFYYLSINQVPKDRLALFLVPSIFTAVDALLLLIIKYRYTLFEKYPYLMNLPSMFYHLGEKGDVEKQSVAFNMIFTVHSLVVAILGLLSLLLTLSIGSSANVRSPFFYSYFAAIAFLIVAVFFLYRRIYIKLK